MKNKKAPSLAQLDREMNRIASTINTLEGRWFKLFSIFLKRKKEIEKQLDKQKPVLKK